MRIHKESFSTLASLRVLLPRSGRFTITAALLVALAGSWVYPVGAQSTHDGSHGQPTSAGDRTGSASEGEESVPQVEDDESHGEEAAPGTEVPITSRIVWQGFGDVGWQRSDEPDRANTFTLGQLTLYPTATVSDRLSVLAEIVFKAGRYNQLTVELERVLIRYAFAESLALSAGRYHTAIGYYNTAYHHSSWLQTTIDRPLPFAFRGPLPIHDVGIGARGSFRTQPARLEYSAELGNGRPMSNDGGYVQNFQDDSPGKAFNLAFAVVPQRIPNMRLGVSVYRDTHAPLEPASGSETIVAGYVVFTNPVFELLNEALVLRSRGAARTNSPAFYSQISHAVGPWRPYARFEYLDLRTAIGSALPVDRRTVALAGLRYDFSHMGALKFEYRRCESSVTGGANVVAANASFAF